MKILIIINILILCLTIFFFIKIKQQKVNLEQGLKKKKQLDQYIRYLNTQIANLGKDFSTLKESVSEKQKKTKSLEKLIDFYNLTFQQKQDQYIALITKVNELQDKSNNYYNQQKQIIEKQLEDFKKNSSKAAENYFANLEKSYEAADAAHIQKMTRLKEEQDKAAADLNKIIQTRSQAYTALLKQKQIKQNKDNYRLSPSTADLQDIHTLERVKQTLHKPRVLSMLIWQTFWQPIAKKQFPIILKDKTKIGIYKITNIKTNQSYIGQSVDIYKRWSQHCKAGLGIDTPVGNKLYKAIQEYGLENFTFEILCECSKDQLNEKEKYFIELYQADLFGYNSQKGNK